MDSFPISVLAKGKKKKEASAKKDERPAVGEDPNAFLEKKFQGNVLEDVKKDTSFTKGVVVDLTEKSGVTEVRTEEKKDA